MPDGGSASAARGGEEELCPHSVESAFLLIFVWFGFFGGFFFGFYFFFNSFVIVGEIQSRAKPARGS